MGDRNITFEENTKQVNRMIARMLACCTVIILILVGCSVAGVFEFGRDYTLIILIAGLFITITPSILIRFGSDHVVKYYTLCMLAVFIGVLGTNNHIGIYITYILVPLFSCLYFEPQLVIKTSIMSYAVMAVALYINSADKYEVIYLGRPHLTIYIAYLIGFTIEYMVVNSVLYLLVKRARQMMEERNSAKEDNRQKSEFLSAMSHEIRTPMNAIIGMADVAMRKDMDDDLRRCLRVIKSSSTGLLEIINDILDLSKIEAGKMNIVIDTYTTESLVEDMKVIIEARNISKKVPIYYHIQEDLPKELEGDVVRLKQVMLNYASNAIKYTESGQIDVTLECKDMGDGYAVLTYTVKDTGQGIRQEDMGRLFTMYSQLNVEKNHSKEGTGIGLAISKYFIDSMGGEVSAESRYGEGSTFSFRLPQKMVTERTNESGKVRVKYLDPVPKGEDCVFVTRGARILLVDDNEINREVIKAMLEPLDLTIREARNGAEAVELAETEIYDMIFMDSHMPVMNGEEATRSIRSKAGINQNTPIIAITADAISGVRERLLGNGMNDYISKPVNMNEICRMIRKYLPESKIVKDSE
ncbi:MAG: response regulator [Suilimivivens sp.]